MDDYSGKNISEAFCDVTKYPSDLLEVTDGNVQVAVTYKKTWDDDFSVRGWKVNATIGEPEIIASTRETGQRINTSVFVHDILDHFLSGFGVSGHRSEAMALIQLAKRTDSNPRPDYEQIIREDFLRGRINGESFDSFLPESLLALMSDSESLSDSEIMRFLKEEMDEPTLVEKIVDRFFTIGVAGEEHAMASFEILDLDSNKREQFGMALQRLLEKVDKKVEKLGVEKLDAKISLNNNQCLFTIKLNDSQISESVFHTSVD